MRKTKIICTMGPATDNIEVLRAMARAGMNVARFNFSHGSHEEHKQRIDRVKAVREEYNLPIALLLDTKGPEIRTGDMQDGKIFLKKGEQIRLTPRACLGTPSKISITYPDLYQDVQAGTSILIDDGLIELRVADAGAGYSVPRTQRRCRFQSQGHQCSGCTSVHSVSKRQGQV